MKILVCVVESPRTEAAVWQGGALARVTNASITLLRVVQHAEEPSHEEDPLTVAREMLSDLAVETRTRQGAADREILAEIQEGGYDLVVIGAKRPPGPTQRLLGSVALNIARHSPVSVWIARGTETALHSLLACTGGREVALPLIETSARLAKVTGACVTLFHVVTPFPSMYTGLEQLEETLPKLLKTDTPLARHLRHGAEILAERQIPAQVELQYGVVADEIIREAHGGAYDLVVLGVSSSTRRLAEWLMGDVTRSVVEHVPCSVLVFKEAGVLFPDELPT
ncbi:MAG: universal stress protein [Anaerolineae bacterium]|jgi:nucleotide-binding universal stress UspA family protein